MKKSIINYIIPSLLLIIALLSIGPGCTPPVDPASTCDDATPVMENLFNDLDADADYYMWPMDLERHEYTFKSSVSGKICALGYQSYQQTTPWAINNSGVTYTLEIVGGPSVSDTFSSTAPEYISITPFDIVAGQEYTIRRTGGDGLDSSSGRSSRPADYSTVTFPFTRGNITFTAATYYDVVGNGGPVNSISIPQILFEFVEN